MSIDRIIQASALLAVMWLPLQLLRVPASPGIRTSFALLLVSYACFVVWITIAAAAMLAPLAILVGAGFAYACWRARPSYGCRRGLPPGSLGLRSSLQALTDYRFYEKQASRHGPIFKTNQYYRPVVCVVGLNRVRNLLHLHREQLASAPLPIDRLITGGLMRYMKSDHHKLYRRLMQSCMTQQVIRDCEPFVADQTRLALGAMADDGTDKALSGVRPDDYIDRMIFAICTYIFFGFQPNEESVPTLMRLYGVIDHRRVYPGAARTRRALDEMVAIVREQAEGLRHRPAAMPSCFLGEAVRQSANMIDDPIFLENLIYFLHVARCDLVGLVAWLLKMLSDHPEWGVRLRSELGRPDPDTGSNNLADRFVAETLRLHQSEYLYRTTSACIKFEGFVIPRGWLLRLCVRESHSNDEVFETPGRFDPDRFLNRSYSQEEYQPFGAYEHACMGVHMTRTVGRILVEQLVQGFDWVMVRDGPMELGLHHHWHWKPSSKFRIRLGARPPRPTSAVAGS